MTVLVLKKLHQEHAGTYTCLAENKRGIAQTSTVLCVTGSCVFSHSIVLT